MYKPLTSPNRTSSPTFTQWAAGIIPTAIMLIVCELIRLPNFWEDIALYTMIVFLTPVVLLGYRWRQARFWAALTAMFTLHVLGLFIACRYMLDSTGTAHFPFVAATMAEGVFVLIVASTISRE